MNNPDFEINLNNSTVNNQTSTFEVDNNPTEFTIEMNGGARGLKGDTGATGPQGIQGDKGDKGDTGEKGDAFVYEDFTPEQLEGLRGPQGIQGIQGESGQDGYSPTVTTSKEGKTTTITVTDVNGTHTATILDGQDGSGAGDMLKSVYDTNDNGIVDNAEKVNNHTVLSDVPNNSKFTDENAIWGNITGVLNNQTDLKNYLDNKANISDIPDVSDFINKNVNNLTYYTLATDTGSTIELNINSSTYVMTLNLKNSAGTTISTDTIDLPLETMVVDASYDNQTKEIILVLKNGTTTRFSVADLVSGLQSEITTSNKLSSDLIDDTNKSNKFVTTSEKNSWNSKVNSTDLQNALINYVGDLTELETTEKSTIVGAVNENTSNISKFGKKLWGGSFTSGSITVDGLSDYTVFIFVLDPTVYCIGSKAWGVGGIGTYASYSTQIYNYRFGGSGDTLTINNENRGGSNGTSNVAVRAIYGLF